MSNAAMDRLRARRSGLSSGYNPLDSLAPVLPNKDNVVYLNADLLHDYSRHPFRARDDEYTQAMLDSIKANGILEPLLVRPHPAISGEYEIIAGHTRNRLGKIAGLHEYPCIIRDLDDDEAVIYMIESNIQRPDWLPSEKAASYKAHLEATARICNKKPGRPSGGNENVGTEFPNNEEDRERLRDIAAKRFGISGRTLEMYIKLIALTPELLKMVDEGRILFKAGVQLSFLSRTDQDSLARLLIQYPHIKVDERKGIDLRTCGHSRWRRILGIEKDSDAGKAPSRKVVIPDELLSASVLSKNNQQKFKAMLVEPDFQAGIARFINEYAANYMAG